MAALVFQDKVLVENHYEHITLALGDWPAVGSNWLWEALCGKGAKYEQAFNDKFESIDEVNDLLELEIKGEMVTVVFVVEK